MEDGVAGSIILFVFLLLTEIVLYGFNTAMQNLKGNEREENEKEEKEYLTRKQKRIHYLMEKHRYYGGAVQLGIVTTSLLFGALYLYQMNGYIQYSLARWEAIRMQGSAIRGALMAAASVLVTILLVYIIVVVGIYIPRQLAARNPEKWIQVFVTPVYCFVRIATPFSALFHATAGGILRLFGIRSTDLKTDVSEEEILSMVNEGHEQGILHASEAEMINNIFEYGDKEAKDIMINRNNLVAIDCTMTLQEAAAFIVDALTDNINRTAANVRSAFTKGQGNIGTQGCVSFMFDKKGQIIIDKEECDMDADDLMMTALDAGAEDFAEEEDCYEIYTDPDQWSVVDAALKEAGIDPVSSEVTMIPQNWVELTDETAIKNLQRTLDLLDEDDDVQAVYHNWDE